MIPHFEPCAAFDEALQPHVLQCKQCENAINKLQQIEWQQTDLFLCQDGLKIINDHLTDCNTCAVGTSVYLQQLAEAFMEMNDKPVQ